MTEELVSGYLLAMPKREDPCIEDAEPVHTYSKAPVGNVEGQTDDKPNHRSLSVLA